MPLKLKISLGLTKKGSTAPSAAVVTSSGDTGNGNHLRHREPHGISNGQSRGAEENKNQRSDLTQEQYESHEDVPRHSSNINRNKTETKKVAIIRLSAGGKGPPKVVHELKDLRSLEKSTRRRLPVRLPSDSPASSSVSSSRGEALVVPAVLPLAVSSSLGKSEGTSSLDEACGRKRLRPKKGRRGG